MFIKSSVETTYMGVSGFDHYLKQKQDARVARLYNCKLMLVIIYLPD